MQSNQDKLNQIQSKVTSGKDAGFDSSLFELASQLGCIGDILGREFEVQYDVNGRINKIVQTPMRIDKVVSLFDEANKYNERQNKMMKSSKGRR